MIFARIPEGSERLSPAMDSFGSDRWRVNCRSGDVADKEFAVWSGEMIKVLPEGAVKMGFGWERWGRRERRVLVP